MSLGIQAALAVPVTVPGVPTGVLDLCRPRPGGLTGPALAGASLTGELAALPLLDQLVDTRAVPVENQTPPAPGKIVRWLTQTEICRAVGMTT